MDSFARSATLYRAFRKDGEETGAILAPHSFWNTPRGRSILK